MCMNIAAASVCIETRIIMMFKWVEKKGSRWSCLNYTQPRRWKGKWENVAVRGSKQQREILQQQYNQLCAEHGPALQRLGQGQVNNHLWAGGFCQLLLQGNPQCVKTVLKLFLQSSPCVVHMGQRWSSAVQEEESCWFREWWIIFCHHSESWLLLISTLCIYQ